MAEPNSCPQCRRPLPFAVDQCSSVRCPACRAQFVVDPTFAIATAETLAAMPPPPLLVRNLKTAVDKSAKLDALRRGRGTNQPKGMGVGTLLAVGCLGLAVLLSLGGVAALVAARLVVPTPDLGNAGNRVAPSENKAQARWDVRAALADNKPLAEGEMAEELNALFKELGRGFREADGEQLSAHFDAERMGEELLALQAAPAVIRQHPQDFIEGLRTGMKRALVNQAPILAWTSFEIRNIKKMPGDKAVVIVRHRNEGGGALKMRWWVTRSKGEWKIYDFEDLDGGLRASAAMGMMMGLEPHQLKEVSQAIARLRQGIQAFVVEGDVDAAEEHLRAIEKAKFPPAIDAQRLFIVAMTQVRRGRFEQALATLERAHRLHADMPCLDLGKGLALNGLGRWEEARTHLQTYRDLLGDDPTVCSELGLSLRGVRRFKEAQAAYRTCLDLNPKHGLAFQGLLYSLAPGEDRSDLAERFTRLDDHRTNFDIFAENCKENQDAASLEALAGAMRKIEPKYAAADYWFALALTWQGKWKEAVPAFQAALTKEKDRAKRPAYLAGLMEASAASGKALEAYATADDAGEAFRLLAAELKKKYRADDLRMLVGAHARKQPDDALLPFYQGDLLVGEEEYAAAAAAFAKGMAQPPDQATLDQFRHSRTTAFFYTGKALTALDSVGPKEGTFQQLASLCWQTENYALLETLITALAKTDPESAELGRERMRLAIQKKEWAAASKFFRVLLAKEAKETQQQSLVGDFLRRMASAGAAREGYRAAPDARFAFITVASTLLYQPAPDELRRLMDAHRQNHPDDVWVAYYEGQLALQSKDWDRAARVLAEALAKAPADEQGSFRSGYIYAAYQLGQGLSVYRDGKAGAPEETFRQLANLLIVDRKGTDLEALVATHRPPADEPERLFFAARAKLFLKKPDEAIPLVQRAYQLQTQEYLRQNYVSTFAQEMAALGQPLEGYRAAPDKTVAFRTLAYQLVTQKKADLLARLLDEHGRIGDTPLLRFFRGELSLLRGEVQPAAEYFTAALAKGSPAEEWQFRNGLTRARIAAGRTVDRYRELGSGRQVFEELAWLVLAEKNAAELQALIAAHRQAAPDDSVLVVWELELRWLKQDYPGVLKLLSEHHHDVFAKRGYREKYSDYRVRCLLKLKRTKEALQEAEALVENKWTGPVVVILVHASVGDVKKALAVLEKLPSPRFVLAACYRHEELGPLLQSEAFKEFRQLYPEPVEDPDD